MVLLAVRMFADVTETCNVIPSFEIQNFMTIKKFKKYFLKDEILYKTYDFRADFRTEQNMTKIYILSTLPQCHATTVTRLLLSYHYFYISKIS